MVGLILNVVVFGARQTWVHVLPLHLVCGGLLGPSSASDRGRGSVRSPRPAHGGAWRVAVPSSLFLIPDPPLSRADVADQSHHPRKPSVPETHPDDTSLVHSALHPHPSPPRLPIPLHFHFSSCGILHAVGAPIFLKLPTVQNRGRLSSDAVVCVWQPE